MNSKSLFFVCLTFFLVNSVNSYFPVLLLPGLFDTPYPIYTQVCDLIETEHPGTECVYIQPGSFAFSWTSMWGQVEWYRNAMQPYFTKYPNGVNVIAVSQGTLIGRAVIMSTPNHTVKNFISLSSPALGFYNVLNYLEAIFQYANIPLPLPIWILNLLPENVVLPILTDVFYTPLSQNSSSVAAYWHDPTNETRFLQQNKFLPYIDNLIPHDNFNFYKTNFLKLNSTYFFAAEKDNILHPWQSARFDYYDSNLNIIPISQQQVYVNDTFGLKTLNDTGRLTLISLPVDHADFIFNLTIFATYVLPLLN